MRKWMDPSWYQYLWRRRLPPQAKVALVSLLIVAGLAGGWFVAGTLTGAQADSGSDAFVLASTTTQKVVTVHEHGKEVVKRIPVVRVVRLKAQKETVVDVRTGTTPGGVSVQRVTRLRYVPVKKVVSRTVTNTVLRNGKTHTVVSVRPVTVRQIAPPVTVSQTQTDSRTQTQVVTNERTVVNDHTETVTLPPVTETQVVTQTRTAVSTATETQTVTVTPPPVTVVVTNFVTITLPGIGG
jgi:hypothetical protein